MSAAIDLAVLENLIGTDPAKLRIFTGKFIDSTRTGLAEMDACLASGDIGRVRELGHRIKSAARIVGAFGMGELCEQLEKLPAPGEHEAARALVARLHPLLGEIAATVGL
jgi:two-component system, sensor histidine kinase and response regulator